MISEPEYQVFFSPDAFQNISQALQGARGLYEVGGVLLGYRQPYTFQVTHVTTPSEQSAKARFTFLLDGAQEEEKIRLLSASCQSPLLPIGIWHSHVNGVPTFSAQDRISNSIFAKETGGAISALALSGTSGELDTLNVYYISPERTETPCEVFLPNST